MSISRVELLNNVFSAMNRLKGAAGVSETGIKKKKDVKEGKKERSWHSHAAFPVISLQLSHKIRFRTITTVCSRRAFVNKSMAWRIMLKKRRGQFLEEQIFFYLLTAGERLAVTGMQAGIKKKEKKKGCTLGIR